MLYSSVISVQGTSSKNAVYLVISIFNSLDLRTEIIFIMADLMKMNFVTWILECNFISGNFFKKLCILSSVGIFHSLDLRTNDIHYG